MLLESSVIKAGRGAQRRPCERRDQVRTASNHQKVKGFTSDSSLASPEGLQPCSPRLYGHWHHSPVSQLCFQFLHVVNNKTEGIWAPCDFVELSCQRSLDIDACCRDAKLEGASQQSVVGGARLNGDEGYGEGLYGGRIG